MAESYVKLTLSQAQTAYYALANDIDLHADDYTDDALANLRLTRDELQAQLWQHGQRVS